MISSVSSVRVHKVCKNIHTAKYNLVALKKKMLIINQILHCLVTPNANFLCHAPNGKYSDSSDLRSISSSHDREKWRSLQRKLCFQLPTICLWNDIFLAKTLLVSCAQSDISIHKRQFLLPRWKCTQSRGTAAQDWTGEKRSKQILTNGTKIFLSLLHRHDSSAVSHNDVGNSQLQVFLIRVHNVWDCGTAPATASVGLFG